MNTLNIYARKYGRYEGRVYLGKDENGKRRYKSYYGATAERSSQKARIGAVFRCSEHSGIENDNSHPCGRVTAVGAESCQRIHA